MSNIASDKQTSMYAVVPYIVDDLGLILDTMLLEYETRTIKGVEPNFQISIKGVEPTFQILPFGVPTLSD